MTKRQRATWFNRAKRRLSSQVFSIVCSETYISENYNPKDWPDGLRFIKRMKAAILRVR